MASRCQGYLVFGGRKGCPAVCCPALCPVASTCLRVAFSQSVVDLRADAQWPPRAWGGKNCWRQLGGPWAWPGCAPVTRPVVFWCLRFCPAKHLRLFSWGSVCVPALCGGGGSVSWERSRGAGKGARCPQRRGCSRSWESRSHLLLVLSRGQDALVRVVWPADGGRSGPGPLSPEAVRGCPVALTGRMWTGLPGVPAGFSLGLHDSGGLGCDRLQLPGG